MNSVTQVRVYYRNVFPMEVLMDWLSHGTPSNCARREFSFTTSQGVFFRYQSFSNVQAFKCFFANRFIARADIGGMYPLGSNSKRWKLVKPQFKELFIDIDITDYHHIRTCCKDAVLCQKCWKLLCIAVEIIHKLLTVHLGLRNVIWFYSGRRGVHCVAGDSQILALSEAERQNICCLLQPWSIKDASSKEDSVTQVFLDVISKYWRDVCDEQDFWNDVPMEQYIPERLMADGNARDVLIRTAFETQGSTFTKWKAMNLKHQEMIRANVLDEKKDGFLMELLMLEMVAPEIDRQVSTNLRHLLRCPFSVHDVTGQIVVPFEPERVSELDLRRIPTVDQVVREWGEYVDRGSKATWSETSLAAYVDILEAQCQRNHGQSVAAPLFAATGRRENAVVLQSCDSGVGTQQLSMSGTSQTGSRSSTDPDVGPVAPTLNTLHFVSGVGHLPAASPEFPDIFYTRLPEDISFCSEDVDLYFLIKNRLKLLNCFEKWMHDYKENETDILQQTDRIICELSSKEEFREIMILADPETRKNDEKAFWITLSSFCYVEPQNFSFLIATEVQLFSSRLLGFTAEQQHLFLVTYLPHIHKIPSSSFLALPDWFRDAARGSVYKGPWAQCSAVFCLNRRSFLIRDGAVYFSRDGMLLILQQFCRRMLIKRVEETRRVCVRWIREKFMPPGLNYWLQSFKKLRLAATHQRGTTLGRVWGQVKCNNIDEMKKHFPPCKYELLVELRQSHHLRDLGRLGLILFLKHIGLEIGEALKLFSAEWQQGKWKRMTPEMTYSIKHKYGRLGRECDYDEPNCQSLQRWQTRRKVSTRTGGQIREVHGCSFTQLAPKELRGLLKDMRPQLSSSDLDRITLAGSPCDSCSLFLSVSRKSCGKDPPQIRAPRTFFFESLAVEEHKAQNLECPATCQRRRQDKEIDDIEDLMRLLD